MSLVSKNNLGFIDGTIVAPARSNILFPALYLGSFGHSHHPLHKVLFRETLPSAFV
uniref:Uncharacterized protein n=1 Tax=Cajanus cajan TaxID=3821 RepID=A0A151SJV7_CAJCA|nr:hypothetical protein KK1_001246 [Cajanus cajan]